GALDRGPGLAHEPRGLAAGRLAQAAPLQQLDVAPALPGQEVRHRGADRATAGNRDLSVPRAGQGRPPPCSAGPDPVIWYAQTVTQRERLRWGSAIRPVPGGSPSRVIWRASPAPARRPAYAPSISRRSMGKVSIPPPSSGDRLSTLR